MNKLKEVKKELNSTNQWKIYKNKYMHKQMQLVFSKIILNINPFVSKSQLVALETKALKASLTNEENMFQNVFKNFAELTQVEANWEAFSKFMFYVYQTSTYWTDIKNNIKNVYNKHNYVEKNAIKREYYYQWINSLATDDNLNKVVLKTMKEVF